MNKLPAYNEALEAEALAFVDDWIADPREPNFFRPDAEEKYGKSMMKHWMQFYPSFGPDEIVYLAENGNQQADLALREMWGEYEQRGETSPKSVGTYIIREINPARARKKPGPGKADHFVHNVGITVLAMELNKRFGLAFYKNPTSDRPTVGTIIAAALRNHPNIGRGKRLFGSRGVEKVLDRFKPIYTGQFPARYLGLYG
jgi:hypothetical protein